MTIAKGTPYGQPGPLPDDGVVVASDAEARDVLEAAHRAGRPYPALGLLGGDLWRTLGGQTDPAHLRSGRAVTFPVDLGQVLADGRLHLFVAHLVARTPWWGRAVVAMNAQWLGDWNLGPRAHPGDGRLDCYQAALGLRSRVQVRARLHHGAHLPHPGITERRVPALQLDLPRPRPLRLDGTLVGSARTLSVRVEPDALRVTV